ncbi:MAG: DMT family transporter [Candidatus Hodarchaeota archaeon]
MNETGTMGLKKVTIISIFFFLFIFSTVYVLTKLVIPPLNGFSYVFLRSSFGALFLLSIIAIKGKIRDFGQLIKNHKRELALTGLYLTLSLVLAFGATPHTTPSNQSLILNLTSVFIILLNYILYKIVPKKIVIVAIALATLGIVLLLSPFEISQNPTFLGDLLMAISTIFGALYTIQMGFLAKKHASYLLSLSLAIFVMIYTLPFFLILEGPVSLIKFHPLQWIILALLGIGITGLLYTFSAVILNDPDVTTNIMAIILTLVPVFGTFLGILLYDEQMTFLNILGAIIVVTGVFMVNLLKKKE